MTQDEILSAAKEAGITYYLTPKWTNEMHGTDQQIIKLVTSIERIVERKTIERCAVEVEEMTANCAFQTVEHYKFASAIAEAIRKLGEE